MSSVSLHSSAASPNPSSAGSHLPGKMFCQAGGQSWAQLVPHAACSPPALPGVPWAAAQPGQVTARAPCQHVKKLPRPLITMFRTEACAQLLDKKRVECFYVHSPETWECHLDYPWPVNELRTVALCWTHRELFQEQETATLSDSAPWEDNWEHFSSTRSTALVFQSCLLLSLPLPAWLWIQ